MQELQLMPTGVPNLDAVLGGGVPLYSLNLIAGQPGTGKTILAQQMLFNHIRPPAGGGEEGEGRKALYLTTLSEPPVKVIRYMQHFTFFDAEAFGERVLYRDIGHVIREHPLPEVSDHIMHLVEEHRPEILVIDSFKAIRDLSEEAGEFRRFCYDLSVRLASARCTTFLVGEYDQPDITEGAEFAVADGIVHLKIARRDGEERRFVQVVKLRGRDTEMVPFPFVISSEGVHILSPSLTLRRREADLEVEEERISTGIAGLDALLRGGIHRGRSIILSGVSGTGKTTLALQFLVHGAKQGEKGLIFSFEETPDRLHRMAEGFGWDLRELEEQGLLRIVFVPQTDIHLEEHLEQMIQEVEAFQPSRFVVDSFSVFLHKVEDPAVQREKTFQLAILVQRAGAVGILTSDIPAGETQRLSCFGVEETVADGIIVLSTEMEGLRRKRYLEVFKMRAADHVPGRHRMEIAGQGIEVFYAAAPDLSQIETPSPLVFEPVEGVIGGGLPYGSAWLVRGDPGMGKSTLSYQFAIEGLRRKEAVLYIAADAPGSLVRQAMESFGFLPDPYIESGQLVILNVSGRGTSPIPAGGREGGRIDLSDPEAFLFTVDRQVERMPKPLRMVFDSLTPLALGYAPGEFVELVHRKNRLLRRPDVTTFDTLLLQMLEKSELYSLLNAFDVVLDLYTPDWGEMALSGNTGYRALRVRKVRGANADTRPYPYVISRTEGVVVQKDYYSQQMG
jgi:circadian clock protein KaiC